MSSMLRAVVSGCGAALLLTLAACTPASGTDGGASCEEGTQGCSCLADRCGKSASGESLLCQGGLCEVMSCPAGERGCVCRGGTQCNAPGDACTNGFCLAAGCTPGSASCSCIAGSCDVGLTCLDGTVCVDSKGYEGGECLDTGRCYRGSRCDDSTNRCVYCDPGTPGCQCTTAGGCNGGLLCIADLCVAATSMPPANAACYTPCEGDLNRSGTTVQCGADGLLPGCINGASCVQGSCLQPGQAKDTCLSDVDCPFFQVCLQGGCYSNCDVNADCPTGLGCFKHACRNSCRVTTGQSSCPTGYACSSEDGQNGFCVPIGRTVSAAATNPTGGMNLPVRLLELSNVKQTGELIVVPRSDITQDITIRKRSHQIFYSDGTTEIVEAPVDSNGAYRVCNAAANECPLWWLKIGGAGAATVQAETAQFRLSPGCLDDVTQGADAGAAQPCPRVRVENAGALMPSGGKSPVRWQGVIELSSGDSRIELSLTYVQRPEGQWTGSMYYFGQFSDKGMVSTDAGYVGWSDRADKRNSAGVENGLIQSWATLRRGNLDDGWQEFLAVLTATRTESWKFGEVKRRCPASEGACYPFTNVEGVRTYVSALRSAPIPSGVSELPVAFNLRISSANPSLFEGRVESSMAMHYPGNPAVSLEFAGNPADATSCSMSGPDCLVYVKTSNATPGANTLRSIVGGRTVSRDGACATDAGFSPVEVPWLVPGFDADTSLGGNGVRVRTECRDQLRPFVGGLNTEVNQALAGGNPIPDGSPRERTLRVLDGALVNQSELFILFEESYASFIPDQPPSRAYGFMRLKRAAADLEDSSFAGRPTTMSGGTATPPTGPTCSPALLQKMLEGYDGVRPLTNAELGSAVDQLLTGKSVANDYKCITTTASGYNCAAAPVLTSVELTQNNVHYWCEDTGFFNGGPRDTGASNGVKVACPEGSRRIFFNGGSRTNAQLAAESCNTQLVDGRGTCFATLDAWVKNRGVVEVDPVFRCNDPNAVFCDDNRLDLRANKTFFLRSTVTPTSKNMINLRALIDSAFRYKTRFRSTSGGTLGFAPRTCLPNSDSVPYCYDPKEIEEARDRIDCLVDIYSRPGVVTGNVLDTKTRSDLLTFLRGNFAAFKPKVASDGGVEGAAGEGFERLYAELLIMQGDESLTSAFASRFDLAAAGGASFPGSKFEKNGIDLTGVAGAEMFQLYQSVQYYQLALDRLYKFGPNMATALSFASVGVDQNFITAETVTAYLERLVRAASQKSRAWAEIAKRYQNFNRPDLARAVIERAYVSTYLESALISRLMISIWQNSSSQAADQINVTIEKAQRNYRMALLDMREVYEKITDEVNYFGYPADYIPFPPLDAASTSSANAVDSLNLLAKQRLDLAKQRELTALSSAKQGRVDAVQFQADLTSVRNTYENQLAQLCGTFKGDDARVYPAIKKYAHQNQTAMLMGDPCGRMGNGDIHNAMANVKDTELRLRGTIARHSAILQDIEIEKEMVAQVCGLMTRQVDYQFATSQRLIEVNKEMAEQRALMNFVTSSVQSVVSAIGVMDCEIQCASSAAMAATVAAAGVAAAGANFATERRVAAAEADLRTFEASAQRTIANFQCNGSSAGELAPDGGQLPGILQVQSNAKVASLLNNTLEVKLEALRAEYSLRVAVAEVGRMFSQAQRLTAQQEEAEQLSIDVQQAQNDPNVRIYQNDAVINADISFKDALQVAYRLTRVFEYYSSQSYAKKEQLYLIRMVSAGQYNLENYLLELENEFINFEEDFGNPDVRVLALSLRDDILKIPYLKEDGTPLDEDARIKMLRERLRDVKLLDSRGYLTLPFSTTVKDVSPVTRNHKIRHVEIDLQGNRMGDSVARVYLRMSGTGVVRNVQDDIDYYVFPERLSVINASILGSKIFDGEIYRNYRFRDRPLMNTLWELVINQRDELANKDIDLGTLSDVRILVYYSDFTTF